VQLCVSDAHEGLKNAIAKVLGCPWQKCTVHFLRDMLGHCGKADQPLLSGAIRQIFAAESPGEARERLEVALTALGKTTPKVARLLEAAEDDLLAFMSFPPEHRRKLRSTNPLERLNREIGRTAPTWSASTPTTPPSSASSLYRKVQRPSRDEGRWAAVL
jgi:putative transposase